MAVELTFENFACTRVVATHYPEIFHKMTQQPFYLFISELTFWESFTQAKWLRTIVNALQHTATHCNTMWQSWLLRILQAREWWLRTTRKFFKKWLNSHFTCLILQAREAATRYRQRAATHCNTLQHNVTELTFEKFVICRHARWLRTHMYIYTYTHTHIYIHTYTDVSSLLKVLSCYFAGTRGGYALPSGVISDEDDDEKGGCATYCKLLRHIAVHICI